MDKLEYYTLYFACAHKDFLHDVEAKKTSQKAYYAVAYFEKDNEFVRIMDTDDIWGNLTIKDSAY